MKEEREKAWRLGNTSKNDGRAGNRKDQVLSVGTGRKARREKKERIIYYKQKQKKKKNKVHEQRLGEEYEGDKGRKIK